MLLIHTHCVYSKKQGEKNEFAPPPIGMPWPIIDSPLFIGGLNEFTLLYGSNNSLRVSWALFPDYKLCEITIEFIMFCIELSLR